jgi:DNA-binding transcriptional MerR regulator
MEKSPGAFRTISEVAVELDVPQHVLRFWESKFAQIKPLKRGGGRRYYRPADIDLLRSIRQLLYSDGYTIRGVQQILRSAGGRDTSASQIVEEEPAPMSVPQDPVDQNEPSKGIGNLQPADRLSFLDELDQQLSDPMPVPIIGIERWKLMRVLEDLRTCSAALAGVQSRLNETA